MTEPVARSWSALRNMKRLGMVPTPAREGMALGALPARRATRDKGRDALCAALERAGLRRGIDFIPEVAVEVEGRRLWVDVLIPRARIVVEVDAHLPRGQRRRERDAYFHRHDWLVIHVRKARVLQEPESVVALILDEMRARGA